MESAVRVSIFPRLTSCCVRRRSAFARQQTTSSTSYAGIDSITISGDANVTITATPGETALLDRKLQWSFRRPTTSITRDGAHLTIRSHCPVEPAWSCDVHLGLHISATTAVDVQSGDGDVTATGMAAGATLHSDNGNVTATAIQGTLHASSQSGNVTIDDGAGSVNARSDNGDVTITGSRASDVDAVTGSGTVRLQLDSSPNTVQAASGNGNVTVGLPDQPGIAYRIDASDGDNGPSVSVRVDPSSPRHITTRSGSGDVRIFYN